MKISCRKYGQGELLVFLHGYAGNVMHWDELIAKLQKQFTCVNVNYSHFYLGRAAYSFSEQVDFVAAWLREQFPGQKVCLVGMSYGGALSWGLASRYPELIRKIVFVNPMVPEARKYFSLLGMRIYFALPMARRVTFLFLSTPVGRRFLKRCAEIFRLQQNSSDRLSHLHGKKMIFVTHLFNNFAWILKSENWKKWREDLKNIQAPMMLVFDDRDPLFASRTYEQFAEDLNINSRYQMSGSGHIPVQHGVDALAHAIENFLTREKLKKVG